MKLLRILVWLIPVGGAALATFILFTGFASATGAPQEAVVAALACAVAILPYVFTRGLSEIFALLDEIANAKVEPHVPSSLMPFESQTTPALDATIFERQISHSVDDNDSLINQFSVWKIATLILGILGLVVLGIFAWSQIDK